MRGLRLLLVLIGFIAAFFVAASLGPLLLARLADANGTIDLLQPGAETGMILATIAPIAAFVVFAGLVLKAVYFRQPIDRILVILGGCLAGALVIPFLTLIAGTVLWLAGKVMSGPAQDSVSLGGLLLYWVWISLYLTAPIAQFGLIFALPILIYAEFKRITAPLFYCLAGALIVPLGRIALYLALGAPDGYWGIGPGSLALIPVGAIAGLVYWRIAGRSAGTSEGAWRQTVASA